MKFTLGLQYGVFNEYNCITNPQQYPLLETSRTLDMSVANASVTKYYYCTLNKESTLYSINMIEMYNIYNK